MPSLNTGNAILSNPIKVDSSYNVGIGGAASGSYKFEVTGTGKVSGNFLLGAAANNYLLNLYDTIPRIHLTNSTTGTATTDGFHIYQSGSDSYILNKEAANLYLGSNNGINLTIASTGAATFSSSISATSGIFTVDDAATNSVLDILTLTHTTSGTGASGLGAGILFRTERPSGGITLSRGAIYGVSGTDADDDGDLAFYTLRDTGAGGFNEKMRILANGNVGIGRTDPSFILDVNDTNASGARGLRISTSSSSAGPALYLYINSGAQTNWAIGNSYAVGNTLEFISSNSVGGNPGAAGTSRMLITPTGEVTINTARTSGANVNTITIADNVTGVQTSGFGTRILATSNNGQAKSAIAFEADGGTNNDTAIAFYTQTNAASLDRRMTINRNGNVLINTTADYGFKFVGSPTGDSFLGNTMQISAGDFGGTERQGAFGVSEWANQQSPVINLASVFPRITFSSRALSVLVQIGTANTASSQCCALVLFSRTSNGGWSSSIISNINNGGTVLNSVSGSGTSITLNFNNFTFGSAMITILNRA